MNRDPTATNPSPVGTVARWLRSHMPTREAMEGNRWLRPIAHLVLRPQLWRFHRRSVPRGVALGTFVGVAVPVAHSPLAALLAVVFDANVPIAFATTWVVANPLTLPLLFWGGWRIGRLLLHMDAVPIIPPGPAPLADAHAHARHAHLFLHHIASMGAATVYGLLVEATVMAAVAYALSSLVWRMRVAARRRARLRAMASKI